MPSYIAFLRAVNVGKRQVKMADLRGWLAEAGYAGVETYIQTGNVRVTTPMLSAARVRERLERLLGEKAGFDVPCFVFSPTELSQVYADALTVEPPPYAGREDCRRYVVFLDQAPTAEQVAAAAAYEADLERVWILGRAAHVWIAGPFAEAKVFAALAPILSPGTNRNLTVVAALAKRWGA